MPKRTDIKSILILGAGPIVIGRHVNSTIQVRRRVKRCVKRVTASFW